MAVTASRKINSKYNANEQVYTWISGAQIFEGHPVALGTDGKIYHLESNTVDGYDVIGVSVQSVSTSGLRVRVATKCTPEIPLKSGVTTAKEGTLVYIDDNGEVTVTNTDHKAGKVVSTENSGKVFIALSTI